jgi:hypothetical protein
MPSKSERCVDGVGPIIRTTVLPDLNAAHPANVTPCVSTPSILLILFMHDDEKTLLAAVTKLNLIHSFYSAA